MHDTPNLEVKGATKRWQGHYWPMQLAMKYQQSVSPLHYSIDVEESRTRRVFRLSEKYTRPCSFFVINLISDRRSTTSPLSNAIRHPGTVEDALGIYVGLVPTRRSLNDWRLVFFLDKEGFFSAVGI